MIWKKTERVQLDADTLSETEVVYSNFSAAQANAEGFILVGTVHFNPGEIFFDEGRAEFVLRRANISAQGQGCFCIYDSIAYIARSTDAHQISAQITKTIDNEKAGEASVEAQAAASATQGFSVGGKAKGALRQAFGEQEIQVLNEETEGKKSLITAIPKKGKRGGAEQVDWRIEPDPLIPYETSSGTYSAVIGERMRAANDGAGLAMVQMSDPDGSMEIRLEVRAADIQWTEIEFSETSPLHKHEKRLIDGKSKRDIVGRLALARALEGSVVLQQFATKKGDG